MGTGRRWRTALLLLLALLAGSAGALSACGPLCAAGPAKPCCRGEGGAPALRGLPPCCETDRAPGRPDDSASRAVEPAAAVAIFAAAPLALPADPPGAPPLSGRLPDPPLLHQGVGLHTLHSVFLI